MSAPSYAPAASRALSYFTERAEDAQAALFGILGGSGPGAGGPSGAERYLAEVDLGSGEQGVKATRAKLESSSEYDRLDGLRTVVAMISKSLPAADHLFPSVLKLTSVQSIQVKTLVYLVTMRLAPSQPDLALLSINSFQRDLSDPSPLIRGMALRVLSGLGVKMASTIMEMAIGKSVRDASFYTRRIAADAIGKCYELSRSTLPALIPHLETLLADRHPSVLGSALLSLKCVAPERYDLLHPHFRRICHALVDIDEWNQPMAVRTLAAYARANLRQPIKSSAATSSKISKWGADVDVDLELLLNKIEPLLMSRNAASVLAAAHVYLSLLPIDSPFHSRLVQPLLRLLRHHPTQACLSLLLVRAIHRLRPDLFGSHTSAFIPASVIAGEPVYISRLKLDVLADIAAASSSSSALKLALEELEEAALERSELSVRIHAIQSLGRLASAPTMASKSAELEHCTSIVFAVLDRAKSGLETAEVVDSAVGVLKTLLGGTASFGEEIPVQEKDAAEIVCGLSGLLFASNQDTVKNGEKAVAQATLTGSRGRASVFWLIGQHCRLRVPVRDHSTGSGRTSYKTLAEALLPEILRKAVLTFSVEQSATKVAILAFGARLHTILPTTEAEASTVRTVSQLYGYLIQLARYDANYAVRDRARYYRGLTSGLDLSGSADEAVLGERDGEPSIETGGVRLRREQVIKVLFDDNVASVDSGAESATTEDPALSLDPWFLAASYSPETLAQPAVGAGLPAWQTDESRLPPSSVREAAVASALPSTSLGPESTPGDLALPVRVGAGIRSLSSEDFIKGGGGSRRAGGGGGKIVLTPTDSVTGSNSGSRTPLGSVAASSVAPQGKGKYRDLDAFLNAESESESESESSDEENSSSSDLEGSSEEGESSGEDGGRGMATGQAESSEGEGEESEEEEEEEEESQGDSDERVAFHPARQR